MSSPNLLEKIGLVKKTPNSQNMINGFARLQKAILNTLDFNEVVTNSVNSVLNELDYSDSGYRIIVLAMANDQKRVLERIAISQTKEAKRALEVTPVPFHDIIIPYSEINNLLIRAIKHPTVYWTNNWYDILRPAYTEEEAAKVQKTVGIKTSMVYPLIVQGKSLGVLIFSMVKDYKEVTDEEMAVLNGFTDLVGLAVQHSLLFVSLKQTTLQLESANQRLQQLDKLKDDFVSIASHELRTPMTAIKSYLWMALYRPDMKLSEKMNKYLSRAYISTERLINLVNDMLNVSRIEAGRIEIRPEPFSMAELVEDVIAEVSAKASERQITVHSIATPVPKVFADPDKVHQVLLNLIGNSLKFTPSQGTITISYFTDGQTVETAISDSGVGMSSDDVARLFQKFGRLDSSYVAAATTGGTGLGLYICKSLVDLMHGRIWATSKGLGKGSTFAFALPIATKEVITQAANYSKKPVGEVKQLEPVAI